MRHKKTILEESIDRISKLGTDPDEFKIWLKSFLITKISDPLPGYSLTEYPYEYLYRINESTKNVRFQERLRCAVKELFKNWNINATSTDTIEYYSSLLNLIAELPVSEMYPDLIEIALAGSYFNRDNSKKNEIDVHALILQIIAGMQVPGDEKLKDRLMDLVRKYIIDIRYTPLCFRIAWQTRYENAIQYIRPLLECWKERKFNIYGTIERFLLGCGVGKFKDLLVPMLQELKLHDMREYFLKILLELGVEIRFSKLRYESEKLVLIWGVYKQTLSRVQIFCDDGEIMAHIKKLNPLDSVNQEIRDKGFWKHIKKFFEPDSPTPFNKALEPIT
jgi:hypothetical protein